MFIVVRVDETSLEVSDWFGGCKLFKKLSIFSCFSAFGFSHYSWYQARIFFDHLWHLTLCVMVNIFKFVHTINFAMLFCKMFFVSSQTVTFSSSSSSLSLSVLIRLSSFCIFNSSGDVLSWVSSNQVIIFLSQLSMKREMLLLTLLVWEIVVWLTVWLCSLPPSPFSQLS